MYLYLYFIHFDLAGGQRAGQPLQVSQFERQQDEADAMINVHRTFRVQEVMRCPIPNVFLKSSSQRLVHPVEEKSEEDEEEENEEEGKMCVDIRTGLRSRGS